MATILEGAQKMQRGEAPPPPIGRLLGFVLKAVEPGRAVFEMEVDERHHNPMGTLHGVVYCNLADAAMGFWYAATLEPGETFTTNELKINFLRAVRKATLTAEARVVKAGSTLGYVQCEIKDQTGKLVAKAASTCVKLRQDCKGAQGNRIFGPLKKAQQFLQIIGVPASHQTLFLDAPSHGLVLFQHREHPPT